ncbi:MULTISPECIES: FkbM family methyltransferase [unclassified Duganella]|uniref:FkbM family methyltransferase n=1 Tax=unclassified Duganella TaxID=2636909 RepID=UPI000E3544B0|nr:MULTISPECIES: FkbM family methyltransferase [unclassified Duganella]RFP11905.1 FkbM family methyltransferase [Duganella sp. BJB475]RFP30085.1 FkbM family methyltransferase [Duganella sp. BJB476]
MSFISYAQNFEDVLLWRALKDVPAGCYIDVGANDPELHSVTKAFYDQGWSGINVEPMPSYGPAFREQRPRDINLNVAAGAESGSITLFDVPDVNGWASTDSSVAAAHRAHGHQVVEHTVPLLTLAEICREHVRGEVHFLKIDVEGFEGDVLRGMDFTLCRPWIVVVEAIMPNSRDSNHGDWEALVTGHRYQYAWFDGLNRYYVADEHAELAERLHLQPNVFDDFITHHLDKAWRRGKELDQQVESTWQLARSADARSSALEQDVTRAVQRGAELEQAVAREAGHAAALEQDVARAARHSAALEQDVARAVQRGQELEQAVNDAVRSGAERAEQLSGQMLQMRQQLTQQLQQRQDQVLQLQAELRQSESAARQLENNLHQTAEWGTLMEQRLTAVYASSSWRLTAPLRALARRGDNSLPKLAVRAAHSGVRRGVRWLSSRPALRRVLIPLISRSPKLSSTISRSLQAIKQGDPAVGAAAVPHLLRELPLSARKVLDDLRRAQHSNDH